MKHNFIFKLSIVTLIVLPIVYFFNKGEGPAIYITCVTTVVILIFGYSTYEFNRLSKIPALNVKKEYLEGKEGKVICIENTSDYPAKNVYIGSFLFSSNGKKHVILYDEIQSQITKFYPVIQYNILKENFRSKFEKDDKKEYKSTTLRQRIKAFISDNIPKNEDDPKIYLVIALRNHFMNDDETLLFFYECECSNQDDLLNTLLFTSKHFSVKEQLYEKSLKEINNRYEEYRKKYKKI